MFGACLIQADADRSITNVNSELKRRMFLYKKQKEKLMQAKNKQFLFLFLLYQTQLKSDEDTWIKTKCY